MFVMYPRLCQNLCLCTTFRQLWTICGSDTEVYPFSKCWRPLFWIFVIRHLITMTCFVCVWFCLLTPNFILMGNMRSWVIAKKWVSMRRPFTILNFGFFCRFRHLRQICVCILNSVQFGRFAADIWGHDFQNGGRPPCWIFEIWHFHHLTFVCVRLCLRTRNFVLIAIQPSYNEKMIFNMASVRHLEIVNFWSVALLNISVCVPDVIKFGWFAAEIWSYNVFKMAAVRHLGFSKFRILITKPLNACNYASELQISS